MPKEKHKKGDKKKKAGKKESQLAIRIEKSERDAFVALCDSLDTSAAREIRRFMREFVAQHEAKDAAASPEADEAAPAETAAEAADPAEAPKRRRRASAARGPETPAAQPRARDTRNGNETGA